MSYNEKFPADDEYLAVFPSGAREQFRSIKEDAVVNAGTVNGKTTGNANGNIPLNNGVLNINLNAQKLNGKEDTYFSPSTHRHDTATMSSNGFMSNTDKKKLDEIAVRAEVNQNAFTNVKVGASTIQADSKTDTLELAQGSNINLVADTTNDKVTIELTGTVPTADKANKDSAGQTINTTYIKEVTGNNDTLTIKKGNNTTSTVKVNNVAHATKAEQDSRGQQIDTTYVKTVETPTDPNQHVPLSNKLQITKGNGQVSTITIDNVANAVKALQDKNGLQIDTNYLKLAGGSMQGLLELFAGSTVPTPTAKDKSTKVVNSEWVQTWVQSFVTELGNNIEVQQQEDGHFSCPTLGVSGLMAQNGYICLGKLFGGLILQWGKYNNLPTPDVTISPAISYNIATTKTLAVLTNIFKDKDIPLYVVCPYVAKFNNSSFNVIIDFSYADVQPKDNVSVFWIAIGC